MIPQEDVSAIVGLVESRGLSESVIAELRQQYRYHFTYCMDDDMEAKAPAIEKAGFSVYFVDSSNHCSVLTPDPEKASGFVFAEVVED